MGLQSLDISKRLSAEGIEPRQAEAIASAIMLAADGSADSHATKQDLAATRGELKHGIADLKCEVQAVRGERKGDIQAVENRPTADISIVCSEMQTMNSDLQLAIEKTSNQMIPSIAAIAGLVLLVDRLPG